MPDNDSTTDQSPANDLTEAIPDSACLDEDSDWSAPLWDDNWDGDISDFGGARLFVATKKWGDGTVDVLIAHYPDAEDSMPTGYAHRHGNDVTPFSIHGPADEVVETVTRRWGPPQIRQTSRDS